MTLSAADRGYLAPLPITAVAPHTVVDGPAPEFEGDLKALFRTRYQDR